MAADALRRASSNCCARGPVSSGEMHKIAAEVGPHIDLALRFIHTIPWPLRSSALAGIKAR